MDEHQNDRQDSGTANSDGTDAAPKTLSPAAVRALAEAEERRKAEQAQKPAPEVGGRGGADPARFGDWEINGRAIDF
ncbi:DUF1674 domain-containing protein [Agrobacterium vitis]|uniref:DUF1674 domain-containing protein n=2 Tax=Rhizobium/Agrobacterium group TaxID=227290 RepID=B9JUJ1_ALLAM|nr:MULTISPECIES: DUF1674 domain-containing protein [Rhizobium/Agrobacterium group]ACM38114.1 conserved hypothetical protein [Allorhizobium ampelinum S4]MCF1446908.1 DUF1674 domain-containing protein [Allorhizobium ampelinum]MCF1461600.1 DUF1674 domain-containing protein [Allorhizobium ampelinum]MCF1491807.1 DUF1674 domain-containing protein [Allorhizobium ampelinum]MUO28821.1 DUF1674 domain-containing protein [Agrobacterium vitis]